MNNNQRLKFIKRALELTRNDIAAAVTAGGIPTSNSLADAWLRAPEAIKQGTGGSAPNTTLTRHREMSDAEFDAFCMGLKTVIDSLEQSS